MLKPAKLIARHEKPVERYIEGVLSGRISAGRLVRLAVDRHVDDLDHAGDRGYEFHPLKAAESCEFFPAVLCHTKGEWARKPFNLSDSQRFITWCLFGWRKIDGGTRRFTRAMIDCARKWGKSEYASGLALKLGLLDDPFEPGAEVYLCATKEDQVKSTTFKQCCRMVEKSKALTARVKVLTKSITTDSMDSYQPDSVIKPIGSDSNTSDGFDLSAAILDEIHAWQKRHSGLYERMTTAGGSRRQELIIFTTTAGDDQSELWIKMRARSKQVLEQAGMGNHIGDHEFSYIATIDENDDPFSVDMDSPEFDAMVLKANPNYPTTPKPHYIRERVKEGQDDPLERAKVLRFHFNKQTASSVQVIRPDLWQAAKGVELVGERRSPHLAMDLGRCDDFAGVAKIVPYGWGDTARYEIRAWTFTCQERPEHTKTAQIQEWIESGHLIEHVGNAVDFGEVESHLIAECRAEWVQSIAYDPTFAQQMGQRLGEELGDDLPVEFVQTPRHYNEACREFLKALKQGRLRIESNPCLDWQALNLTYKHNNRSEVMPDKGRGDEYKIDTMVAIIMAFAECLFAENDAVDYSAGSLTD